MGPLIPAVELTAQGGAALSASVRRAGRGALEAALRSGREQLLALFEGFERALSRDGLRVAFDPVLNLPQWELGHMGWFELACGKASTPKATQPALRVAVRQ